MQGGASGEEEAAGLLGPRRWRKDLLPLAAELGSTYPQAATSARTGASAAVGSGRPTRVGEEGVWRRAGGVWGGVQMVTADQRSAAARSDREGRGAAEEARRGLVLATTQT